MDRNVRTSIMFTKLNVYLIINNPLDYLIELFLLTDQIGYKVIRSIAKILT